ncbi:hypothetical protein BN871_FQ_00030 [Paenibacillus sp. P22]|nr:hypothetical protein BN871_FQ_00030 [Paenibacillus sp. P22]
MSLGESSSACRMRLRSGPDCWPLIEWSRNQVRHRWNDAIHTQKRRPAPSREQVSYFISPIFHALQFVSRPYDHLWTAALPLLPNLIRDLLDQRQLAPLLLLGQDIALFRGGEAALRAQADPVDVDVLPGFPDALENGFLILELAVFGREQPQHDLSFSNMAQRLEAARAVRVELQVITVQRADGSQLLGYRLVPSGARPGGGVIAAAYMRRHGQIPRQIGDCGAVHLRVELGQIIQIGACGLEPVAELRIAQHAPGAVVELDAAAAGVVEGQDRVAVSAGYVRSQVMDRGIDGIRAGFVLRTEQLRQQLCRRRDRLARDGIRARCGQQEPEVLDERMAAEGDPAGQPGRLGARFHAFEQIALRHGRFFHPVQMPHEVEMPPGPAELPVGYGLQSDLLLLGDQGQDLPVLDRAQLLGAELSGFMAAARFLQCLGAEEASHHVEAVGSRMAGMGMGGNRLAHGNHLSFGPASLGW